MAFVFCEAIVCLMLFIEWHYRLGQVTYNIVCTARRSYASAVLGVVILSVRPSHACFVTNPKNLPAIFLYHMKGQSFEFPDTKDLGEIPTG